jgi:hypothetical protein
MVTKESGAGLPESVEQAMNKVLEAEREAEQAIADCEIDARQILQAAQQRVKRIADRTNQRITLTQLRMSQKVREQSTALERADRASSREPLDYELDEKALKAVVNQVAAELTGNRRSDGSVRSTSGSD